MGWGEAPDEPAPLRFAAPPPAREDARPTDLGFGPHALQMWPPAAVGYQECFSRNLFSTSASVPLKGPGVSILIETSAAANFREAPTS